MSGGSLNYIQYRDVEDFCQHACDDENIAAAGKQLSEYGELGASAKDDTEKFLSTLQLMRARHRREVAELESSLTPALRNVWKQLDYEGSNDVSKDDVRAALAQFNLS